MQSCLSIHTGAYLSWHLVSLFIFCYFMYILKVVHSYLHFCFVIAIVIGRKIIENIARFRSCGTSLQDEPWIIKVTILPEMYSIMIFSMSSPVDCTCGVRPSILSEFLR